MFYVLFLPSFFADSSAMASEQNGLGPEINRLNFPDSSAEPLSLNCKELENFFAPLFDDFLEENAPSTQNVSAATTDDNTASSPKSTTTAQQTASNTANSADDLKFRLQKEKYLTFNE